MSSPANAADRLYIHEFIDIRGHHRADYMHHMTANWSPQAQETRNQLCFGVWAVLGTTGAWPQVVNLWEEQGWSGLAESFAGEAVGPGAQDPVLERWWAKAAEFRRGGFDRLLEPASWSVSITDLCAEGVDAAAYAHDLVSVRPGAAGAYLDLVRDHGADAYGRFGWRPLGAFTTAMVNDDECIVLWALPSWASWAAAEAARRTDNGLRDWHARSAELVTGFHRILLVDAPLSPLRTGRQPHRDDRTDWTD